MFGNFKGAVRRERGGKEKEWTDCVQSDVRAFGISGGGNRRRWRQRYGLRRSRRMGGRFMATRRKEEVDTARYRQEKRKAARLGKLLPHTESLTCEATPIGLVHEPKKPHTDARQSET